MIEDFDDKLLNFTDLETRYGQEQAYAILRVLEQFEGVQEEWVAKMSREDRLDNVFRLMSENILYQTRH